MAASAAARAILVSYFSLKPSFLQPQTPLLHRPLLPPAPKKSSAICCLISGFEGGGSSDEFVSTRKFGHEFAVIANMLRRIEPLDNSVISKGVSDSAKDSMKQTISTMLGLLPSDQFSVTVRVSKDPLDRLIVSSIVTGYTLWNAEYRISLKRNFDISSDTLKRDNFEAKNGAGRARWEPSGDGGDEEGNCGGLNKSAEALDRSSLQSLGDLSPEAIRYIQQLESELSAAEQEFYAQKNENLQMEHIKKSDNNLLEYLRSLESDMVTELSRPSSHEVEEVIHELAQTILRRICRDVADSGYEGDLGAGSVQNNEEPDSEIYDVFHAKRDYLAKLLFWCMLLGHHLRGLENRLQLSCVVGLL
ncbi:uncharacterized protein LOC127258564 [Andrographis paniculata]|uniref:uncharacterized protein LOC127258564 n=1 Tax=Andrographis paniculata TaxID=175694 RepID=UPI0021E84BBB|nr:uncharacterized protein LOC127258564 [Andrographis paniculata]